MSASTADHRYMSEAQPDLSLELPQNPQKITCSVTVLSSAGVFLLCFLLVRNNLMTVAAEEIRSCFAGIAIADNCIICSFLLHAIQSSLWVQYTLFSSTCNDY